MQIKNHPKTNEGQKDVGLVCSLNADQGDQRPAEEVVV